MYENGIRSGLFDPSIGSWAAAAPLENLKDPRPNKKARTTSLALTDTRFLLSLPYARSMRGALLVRTNFHQSGRVRITGHSNVDLSSPVATTDWVSVGGPRIFDLEWEDPNYWSGRIPRTDPDAKGLDVPVIFDNPIVAKHWLYEFDNAGNQDGFFSVGVVYMGTVFQPTRNFAPGATMGSLTSGVVKESNAQVPYAKRRARFPMFECTLQNMPEDEAMVDFARMIEVCGETEQIAVFVDPDAASLDKKQAFVGRFVNMPPLSFDPVDYKSTSISIKGYP